MTDGWHENTLGRCPPRLLGTAKRVFVELRNGTKPADSWPADTGRWRANTNWHLDGSDWSIIKWKES